MRLVAVGFVVLLFVVAATGYWAYSESHQSLATSPAPPLFSYSQSGTYTYVAQLAPNVLYNTTELTQGNGTLFTAITNWVNLTFIYHAETTPRTNLTSTAVFSVTLESSVWSKLLFTSTLTLPPRNSNALSFTETYDLNVAQIVTLAQTVEAQTGFFPSSYSVLLTPTISTAVTIGDNGVGLFFAPTLNLTFASDQIQPGSLATQASGAYGLPGGSSPNDSTDLFSWASLPYWALVGSLALLTVAGVYTFRGRGARAPDLETLMRPYREAIVNVSVRPAATEVVRVRDWEDLVKVADTLGRPILRVVRAGKEEEALRSSFYVLLGTTAYVYTFRTPPSGTIPNAPPWDQSVRSTTYAPWGGGAYAPVLPDRWFPSLHDIVDWTGWFSERAKMVTSSSLRLEAEELLLRTIALAQSGELVEAWITLGRLGARLGGSIPSRPSAPGS